MYALTLRVRPRMRQQWIERGFKRIWRRGGDALYRYWEARLKVDSAARAAFDAMLGGQEAQVPVSRPKGSYPSPARMAANLASSMAKWVAAGMTVVNAEQFDMRLAVCRGCEKWDGEALAGLGRCQECGCSTQAKLRLATEQCPLGRWFPVTAES